ncbi:hypothetical protein BH23CHL5_BH23CHL5_24850 [soil metagenome]
MRTRVVGAILLGLAMVLPISGAASAQTDTQVIADKAAVSATARTLFEQAANGNFRAMYESMHPDARAEIPANVAIGFLNDVYSVALAEQAQIVGVDVGTWTWPITDTFYQDAAAVIYVMPVLNETGQPVWTEETLYFAWHDGRWAWFLGSSREFVDQINAQYANASTDSGSLEQTFSLSNVPRDQVIQIVANDLDDFYREVVGFTEFTYETPGVVVVSANDTVMSACGPASTGFYGFYCPLDSTMYLDEPFLLDLVDNGSAFSAAFVIAHEWAHHVQTGIGFERTQRPSNWNQVHSIELELMADCFSGAWARDAELRGLVDPGDIVSAINEIVFSLGDPKFIGENDPQAHGNGEQRVRATLNGYEDGFLGCNLSIVN